MGNKARVEGSICNAYLAEEISNFCSQYFRSEIDTNSSVFCSYEYHVVESQHGVDVPELSREDCGDGDDDAVDADVASTSTLDPDGLW